VGLTNTALSPALVPNVVCSPASGSTFNLSSTGTTHNTTVICTATDASANSASCSFTVTVSDVTAPTFPFGCPVNQSLFTEVSSNGVIAVWENTATADNSGRRSLYSLRFIWCCSFDLCDLQVWFPRWLALLLMAPPST
jgi:hypothetical protein